MNTKKTLSAYIIIGLVVIFTIAVTTPQTKAQFVLAGWDFPDEYGQGIDGFEILENSTGAWKHIDDPFHGFYDYESAGLFNWTVDVAIKLRCFTWFNNTLIGADDAADGKNYQKHNVTVTNLGLVIFSQQNFTYYSVADGADPMWYYAYEVILNFLPVSGLIYTATVTYEVYW